MKDNELQSIDILKELDEKVSNYLSIKNNFITLLNNDYIEVFGDTFTILRFLKNSSSLLAQKRFVSFLKGLSQTEQPDEKQLVKLLEYIDDEAKAEFIAETFSKILLSKSSIATFIMGINLHKIIDSKDSLNHNDLICSNALVNFFDIDIKNFYFVSEYFINNNKTSLYIGASFKEECKTRGLDIFSVLLTIEKAISYQLMSREFEIDLDIDSDDPSISSAENDEYYRLTKPGLKLFYKIKELNIISIG